MSAVYSHPEGGAIALVGLSLKVTSETGRTASVPIGPRGLLELAEKIKAHVADFDRDMCHPETEAPHPPILDTTGYNPHRPPPMTMGQHLDNILTHRILKGVTRFTVFSESYWRELKPGAPNTFDLHYYADTERMVPEHAIEIHIAAGVSRDVVIAALKAICKEVENLQSLESFTPREPEPIIDLDTPF